ncbi:DUF6056 family protein [Bacteroides finegoldii]|jgi:hypothetical protein|uniref:DUF6056 family protein n=1 Tax=Bacteroides finegoldii TaxID=338188 RepID=UPI0026DD2757|nr:DUF6056 family protein [Bacteroides finegoldii]
MKKQVFDTKDYFFYLIVAPLFFFLSRQYLQVHEDLGYAFSLVDGSPISGFPDAMASQAWAWMHTVARFAVHTFVQYFCAMANKTLFFIISTLMFVLLHGSLLYILRGEFGKCTGDKYLVLSWLWLLTPIIGTTFLGHIAFVVNYLWAAALNAYFVALFINLRIGDGKCKLWHCILLFGIAVFIGGFQESFSVCICATFFFYALINRKYLRQVEWGLIVGYLIGTLTIVFAPGNISRLLQGNGEVAHQYTSFVLQSIVNLGRVLCGYWPMLVFIVVSTVAFLLKRRKAMMFFKRNGYYMVAMVVFVLFTTFIAYTARHQLTCLSLLLLILFLKFIYGEVNFKLSSSGKDVAIFILVGILLLSYYQVYKVRNELCNVYSSFEERANRPNDTLAVAREFVHFDKVVMRGSLWREHTNLTHAGSQVYYKNGVNALAYYLKKENPSKRLIATLPDSPERIAAVCCADKECDTKIYSLSNRYYVVRYSKEADPSSLEIVFQEQPVGMKAKLFSLLKRGEKHERQMKASDIEMKFTWGDYCYACFVEDRENNGYVMTNIRMIDGEGNFYVCSK